MKLTTFMLAITFIGALFLSSCKKDDASNPVTPPPTVATHASGGFVGMIAGTSETGVLSLNIATTSPKSSGNTLVLTVYTVSGSVLIGGVSVPLTGTYNTVNDSLYVSGGGYSFAGTYNPSTGVLVGSYTGPHGSGGFSSQPSSGSDSVRVYLGTSASLAGHSASNLNIVTKGTALIGMAVTPGGTKTPFYGVISGTTITLKISYNGITANLGTGTLSGDLSSAQGTYDTSTFESSGSDHGTWTVSRRR